MSNLAHLSGAGQMPTPADYVPSFALSLEEAKARMEMLQQFVSSQMVKGQDYGEIPGVDKPTLLKPGAEKLLNIYGFGCQLEQTGKIEDWDKGFFHFVYKASVINKRTGMVEAECEASANSKEAKYRYNWVPEWKLPPGIDTSLLTVWKEKETHDGRTYKLYRLENEDPYTLVNTLMKMAQKRALVGATLAATRTSAIFTQDVEDMGFEDRDAKPQGPAKNKPASPKQIEFLRSLAEKKGMKGAKLTAWVQDVIGRPVSSAQELTSPEASKVIEALKSNPEQEAIDRVHEEYQSEKAG